MLVIFFGRYILDILIFSVSLHWALHTSHIRMFIVISHSKFVSGSESSIFQCIIRVKSYPHIPWNGPQFPSFSLFHSCLPPSSSFYLSVRIRLSPSLLSLFSSSSSAFTYNQHNSSIRGHNSRPIRNVFGITTTKNKPEVARMSSRGRELPQYRPINGENPYGPSRNSWNLYCVSKPLGLFSELIGIFLGIEIWLTK